MDYFTIIDSYTTLTDAHVSSLSEGASNFMDGLQNSILVLEQQINLNNDLCYLIKMTSSRPSIVATDSFSITLFFANVPRTMSNITINVDMNESYLNMTRVSMENIVGGIDGSGTVSGNSSVTWTFQTFNNIENTIVLNFGGSVNFTADGVFFFSCFTKFI